MRIDLKWKLAKEIGIDLLVYNFLYPIKASSKKITSQYASVFFLRYLN